MRGWCLSVLLLAPVVMASVAAAVAAAVACAASVAACAVAAAAAAAPAVAASATPAVFAPAPGACGVSVAPGTATASARLHEGGCTTPLYNNMSGISQYSNN